MTIASDLAGEFSDQCSAAAALAGQQPHQTAAGTTARHHDNGRAPAQGRDFVGQKLQFGHPRAAEDFTRWRLHLAKNAAGSFLPAAFPLSISNKSRLAWIPAH